MRSQLVLLATAAALAVTTAAVYATGGPAAAAQGLRQTLTSEVVLDAAVSGGSLHFCAFGSCVSQESGPSVTERLAVTLTYDVANNAALPDVLSTAGRLSIPDRNDPDHACDGKQGVRLHVSDADVGTTTVAGSAKGQGRPQTIKRRPDAPAVSTGTVVLCIDVLDIRD